MISLTEEEAKKMVDSMVLSEIKLQIAEFEKGKQTADNTYKSIIRALRQRGLLDD